jgi:hypothetical protein
VHSFIWMMHKQEIWIFFTCEVLRILGNNNVEEFFSIRSTERLHDDKKLFWPARILIEFKFSAFTRRCLQSTVQHENFLEFENNFKTPYEIAHHLRWINIEKRYWHSCSFMATNTNAGFLLEKMRIIKKSQG